jgi:hypothetical protein
MATFAPPIGAQEIPDSLDGEPYLRIEGLRVDVYYAGRDSLIAREVLAVLDAQRSLPGLSDSVPDQVRAVLAHTPEAFDEVTGGAVPEWRAGVAIPSQSMLVMPTREGPSVLSLEGRRTLRHEWAHLGLVAELGGLRAPRWFNEGYAQWASGGFDATEVWRLRVLLALGRTPPMDSLELRWPSGRTQAEIAYLLSASAITYLLAGSGDRGLAVFIERWKSTRSFETAFRSTFGLTTAQFEEDWKQHIKKRYGWLFVLSHSTVFWMILALVLLVMVRVRQGRNREHMARLRAEELPDDPAFWTDDPDESGSGDSPPGVEAEP